MKSEYEVQKESEGKLWKSKVTMKGVWTENIREQVQSSEWRRAEVEVSQKQEEKKKGG